MAGSLLERISDHLVGQGIARAPGTAGSGTRPWPPPFWRAPLEGAPAPGEKKGNELDDGLVVSAYATGDLAPAATEGRSRRRIVDFRVRSKSFPAIEAFDRQLVMEFAPPSGTATGIPGLRLDWTLAGLYILESRQWRGLQPLDIDKAQGFTYVVAYMFEHFV